MNVTQQQFPLGIIKPEKSNLRSGACQAGSRELGTTLRLRGGGRGGRGQSAALFLISPGGMSIWADFRHLQPPGELAARVAGRARHRLRQPQRATPAPHTPRTSVADKKRFRSAGLSLSPLGRSRRQPWGPVPGAVAAWPLCPQGSPASRVTSPRPSPRCRWSSRRKALCSFPTVTEFSQRCVRGAVAGRGRGV